MVQYPAHLFNCRDSEINKKWGIFSSFFCKHDHHFLICSYNLDKWHLVLSAPMFMNGKTFCKGNYRLDLWMDISLAGLLNVLNSSWWKQKSVKTKNLLLSCHKKYIIDWSFKNQWKVYDSILSVLYLDSSTKCILIKIDQNTWIPIFSNSWYENEYEKITFW